MARTLMMRGYDGLYEVLSSGGGYLTQDDGGVGPWFNGCRDAKADLGLALDDSFVAIQEDLRRT